MWINSIVRWILRSPLHGLCSNNTMLITYRGRKSGKKYTVPVNYVRQGSALLVKSFHHRTWWRNLRGGAEVVVRWRGQDQEAAAEVVEDEAGVRASLMSYLQAFPAQARYFKVAIDSHGHPEVADVNRVARERVIVRVRPRQRS